ncbi:hypothetical protein EJB05_46044, partial [Eragrostis curvula]
MNHPLVRKIHINTSARYEILHMVRKPRIPIRKCLNIMSKWKICTVIKIWTQNWIPLTISSVNDVWFLIASYKDVLKILVFPTEKHQAWNGTDHHVVCIVIKCHTLPKGNESRTGSRFFTRRGKVRRLKYTWKSGFFVHIVLQCKAMILMQLGAALQILVIVKSGMMASVVEGACAGKSEGFCVEGHPKWDSNSSQ